MQEQFEAQENKEFFHEIEFECPNCHKKIKMLKRKDISTEGMLCQRCGLGTEKFDSNE